jgi:hypothetical protein
VTLLAIRNWADYQHYKDRDPLWIKVYSRLLDDADFLALPEAAQAQLVKLWLVASRCKNRIRDDKQFLQHALHTNRLHIETLIAARFVERIASDVLAEPEQVASKLLAKVEQNASPHARPRARGEGETELETETTPPPARVAFLAAMPKQRLPGWKATLSAWTEGMGTPNGKAFTAEQIDAGLAEYMASEPNPDFSPQHVVRFVEKCATRTALPVRAPRDEAPTFTELLRRREGAA